MGSVAVLRSLIRILRASLAQIDTEMAEKYAKLGEKYGLGSKVNQFVHVPTSVDMQHLIQIHVRVF